MTTWREVIHIWRKDWERTRWQFVLMCVVLGFTTAQAIPAVNAATTRVPIGWDTERESGMQLLCGLVALLFIATVVQDDSPSDSRMFWRAQPVSSRSVLLVKLLHASGVVVALAVGAQMVTMATSVLPVASALGSLGVTIYWVLSFALFAMLVASVTPGTQAFLLAIASAGALRLFFLSGALDLLGAKVEAFQNVGLRADLWIVAAAGCLVWVYLGRRAARTVRIAVVAVVLTVLTIGWNSGQQIGVRFLSGQRQSPDASQPKFRASVIERDSGYTLRLETDAPPNGYRYALPCSEIDLKFADSSEYTIWPLGCYGSVPFALRPDSANSAVVSAVFYLGRRPGTPGRQPSRAVALLFDGFLELQSVEAVGELPAHAGAVLLRNDARLQTIVADSLDPAGALRSVTVYVLKPVEPAVYGRVDQGLLTHKSLQPSLVTSNTVRFSESGFFFRAIETADTNSVAPALSPRPIRTPAYSLALPSPESSRSFPLVYSPCGTWCPLEWWQQHKIAIFRWKHVSFTPVYAEFPVQR
ncbi:MAG: hypothetical protein ABJB74_11445 [Gemmatimonas sp.]